MILLNIDGSVIFLFFLIGNSPALLLLLIGAMLQSRKPKTAKVLFIIAGIYLVIGLGVCGLMF